jgi:hypothetical protein
MMSIGENVQRYSKAIYRRFGSRTGGREYRLHIARETLIELKMSAEFPFLHLENLQEIKASIIK